MKNTFKNPFEEFNAANLDDDQLLEYWIEPEILFKHQIGGGNLTSLTPMFIFGGRGTGKTSILKYFSFDLQEKEFMKTNGKNNLKGFLNSTRDFLGIYYRFEGPQLAAFNQGKSKETCIENFRMFVELVLVQKYLLMIEQLIKKKAISAKINQKKICSNLCMSIFGSNIKKITNLEILRKELGKIQFLVEKYRDGLIRGIDVNVPPIIPRSRLIDDVPEIISKEIPELKKIKILYIFDEYENLTKEQQLLINTLIKHRKNLISYKIGSRTNGLKTKNTLNDNEYLKDPADYRSMTIETILSHKKNRKSYHNLLSNIARKRLEKNPILKKHGITDIVKLLGTRPSSEEEAMRILNVNRDKERHLKLIRTQFKKRFGSKYEEKLALIKCPKKPLIEKLNVLLIERGLSLEQVTKMMKSYLNNEKSSSDYKTYKTLYEKNETGLLFQFIGDYRRRKKLYVGFETYSIMSHGIIRNFMELCNLAFNHAMFSDLEGVLSGKPISIEDQDEASFDESSIIFDDITSIPNEFGVQIQRLVENIGSILRALHKNRLLSEPEPSYITTDFSNLDADVLEVVNSAIQWSCFFKEKSMLPKESSQSGSYDLVLNKMLCPYYSISYRKRGRTFIKPDELKTLIFGTSEEQKIVREKITKEKYYIKSSKLNQPKLSDYL